MISESIYGLIFFIIINIILPFNLAFLGFILFFLKKQNVATWKKLILAFLYIIHLRLGTYALLLITVFCSDNPNISTKSLDISFFINVVFMVILGIGILILLSKSIKKNKPSSYIIPFCFIVLSILSASVPCRVLVSAMTSVINNEPLYDVIKPIDNDKITQAKQWIIEHEIDLEKKGFDLPPLFECYDCYLIDIDNDGVLEYVFVGTQSVYDHYLDVYCFHTIGDSFSPMKFMDFFGAYEYINPTTGESEPFICYKGIIFLRCLVKNQKTFKSLLFKWGNNGFESVDDQYLVKFLTHKIYTES